MEIIEKLLTINPYSRAGRSLSGGVKGIVVHWVANPKTSAQQNRDYFELLKNQNNLEGARYAGAHFVIGLEGEVIRCIPENEMGYHVGADKYRPQAICELSNYPNNCTLGIELCHINWDGEFSEKTLDSTRELIKNLCYKYKLARSNIYRHYDITGKDCPRYFVQHEEAWDTFLDKTFLG